MRRPLHLFLGSSALALAGCSQAAPVFDATALRAAGAGAYSTELLAGEHGPSDRNGKPVLPKVTADFKGPPTTNDWWSSMIWQFDADPYSHPMFPHPLAVKARSEGLGIGYPSEAVIGPREYRFPYAEDLRLSVTGLKAPDTRVSSYSDWAVTAVWANGGANDPSLSLTFGHGLPFVYARTHGDARVELIGLARADRTVEPPDSARVWSQKGEVVGLTLHGHHYGLFAPTGSTWRVEGSALISDLSGKGFYSVAVLPDDSPSTLELFRTHAYAFVTDTHVDWKADPKGSKLTSHFGVQTTLVDSGPGHVNEPLLALYPHQWKATTAALSKLSYVSPRGELRLLAANGFDVERPLHGILPVLPELDREQRGNIAGLVRTASHEGDMFPVGLDGAKDTYWAGKSLGRVANLAWMAHELGDEASTRRLVRGLEKELDDWFDGKPPNRFYYDAQWHALIGFPAGYQSGTELNDHHFHYGYFIWAAATVAALDPAFRAQERWGAMVSLLMKDVANTDASDTRFPRLRYFDAYAGHSWANGPEAFDEGNNEESSSEDMNFSAAVNLWGTVTGDANAQALGSFLFETTSAAVDNYWLDVDRDVFPKGFDHPVAGIVWGDGAKFATWWDPNPIYVHGINMLPFTGASLYLGRKPSKVKSDYEALVGFNRGPVHQWRDVLWMDLALADAPKAASFLDGDHYFQPEFGNSWAAVYYWVANLRALGQVDPTVLADTSSFGVFASGSRKTYAAYNPGSSPLLVHFSDGATLDVAPHSLSHSTRPH